MQHRMQNRNLNIWRHASSAHGTQTDRTEKCARICIQFYHRNLINELDAVRSLRHTHTHSRIHCVHNFWLIHLIPTRSVRACVLVSVVVTLLFDSMAKTKCNKVLQTFRVMPYSVSRFFHSVSRSGALFLSDSF